MGQATKQKPEPIRSALLDIHEAAEYLNVSVRCLRRRIYECRDIRYTKVGGRIQFKRAWLDDYIERNTVEPEDW